MHAGKHVFHEALVTRHIDEPNACVPEVKVCKTKIDRDATPLLFG